MSATQSTTEFDERIESLRRTLNETSANHPYRSHNLNSLGSYLGLRYSETGATADLEESIQLAREAVRAAPNESHLYYACLDNLAVGLGDRYKAQGKPADLDETIQVAQAVVNATPADYPERAVYVNNLASQLSQRYSSTGSTADLNKAIEFYREAVNTTPNDDARHNTFANNLAATLGSQYERFGELSDLEEAIQISQRAVDATPSDHPLRARMLNTLANRISDRYTRFKAIADLEEAVRLAEEAVSVAPSDHPDQVGFLDKLGILLGEVYLRTGSRDSLERAIQIEENVVEMTPKDDPRRALRLNNLAIRVRDHYLATAERDSLEKTILLLREAITLTTTSHPDRAQWLFNLSVPLANKYHETKAMSDLQEVIDIAQNAISALPNDHPNRAAFLNALGDWLSERYSTTHERVDLTAIISNYESALHQTSSNVLDRISSGKRVLRYHAINSEWQKAYEDTAIAIDLIPRLTSRALSNSDKQTMLGQIVSLACDATAAALEAGKEASVALKLLEQGRGILATSLEEMRADLINLQAEHPELAKEFVRLRDVLDGPSTQDMSQSASPNYANTRSTAGREFDDLILEVRQRSGFEDFLLPPSEKDMIDAARHGPIVVINISEYRCDALLVEQDKIWNLPLTGLKVKDIGETAQRTALGSPEVLTWLWDTVTKPVLDALGCTQAPSDDNWPHVWWIATGSLSKFPLHAAGYHREGSAETVLDRVMSSYSSSIKAIIQGRRRRALEVTSTKPVRALLVSMSHTRGYGPLENAAGEVRMVRSLCSSASYRCIMPRQYKADVMSHLPNCKIFHFAGHGSTNATDPSKSYLLLEDWEEDPLTVANLFETNLHNHSPFLAYLSACGTGEIQDDRYFDESLHLISACQLAGFRHVIGTLWSVDDEKCLYMAETTYKEMIHHGMTDTSVCLALHKATRGLRDNWLRDLAQPRYENGTEGVAIDERSGTDPRLPRKVIAEDSDDEEKETPSFWVPYVHFGV